MSEYQEMSRQLEILIEELRTNKLDIDEAISKYEESQKLISKMQKYLSTAENKVAKIKAKFE